MHYIGQSEPWRRDPLRRGGQRDPWEDDRHGCGGGKRVHRKRMGESGLVICPNLSPFAQAEDGELILLDASSATRASLKNTWFIGMFRWVGGKFMKQDGSGETETADDASPGDSGSETGGYDSSSSKKARRMAAGRAGGMRRKAVKPRKPVKAVP